MRIACAFDHAGFPLKQFVLDNYLFGVGSNELSPEERQVISKKLRREMLEIFYGRNMSEERSV